MAQYKGTGTINGQNNPQEGGSPYYFILTARDGALTNNGSPDGFRIQITNSTGTVIYYDNLLGADATMSSGNTQDLSGTSGNGSVVIHSK
jgi:hypothetical protein